MRRVFYASSRFMSIIVFPTFIGLTILAPEIIIPIFGSRWIPSIAVMQVMACTYLLRSMMFQINPVIISMGKPSWVAAIEFVEALLVIVAVLFSVRWGIVAVAMAHLICACLLAPLRFYAVKSLIKIQWRTYFHQYRAALISSAVMVFVIYYLKIISKDFVSIYVLLLSCVITGANGLKYSLCFTLVFNISFILGLDALDKMLLDPKALGPHSILPWNHPTTLLS